VYARQFLPTLISKEHLDWLATWDFAKGFVPAKYFDLFSDLLIELDRTTHGIRRPGLRHWLNEDYRLQLSQCLPAAVPLFEAIQSFAQAVNSETVPMRMSDGNPGYGHGQSQGAAGRITRNWKTHAQAVLTAYREIVDGGSAETLIEL